MPWPRKIAYEKFAQFVASGLSLAESYRRTTGQTKNADVKGDQWHGYAGVKERIAELKAQNAQRAQMTREELLVFYAEVIRTPADQVPAGSPVIQSYEQDGEGRVKLRLCDKVMAGAQLCRMCGWEKPTKFSLSGGDTLSAYLVALRRMPFGGGRVIDLENGSPAELENGEEPLATIVLVLCIDNEWLAVSRSRRLEQVDSFFERCVVLGFL
jgi:hypothetical protein